MSEPTVWDALGSLDKNELKESVENRVKENDMLWRGAQLDTAQRRMMQRVAGGKPRRELLKQVCKKRHLLKPQKNLLQMSRTNGGTDA